MSGIGKASAAAFVSTKSAPFSISKSVASAQLPRQRQALVEEGFRPGNHTRAANRVVSLASRQITHRIRAVERIIERAPAGIGGIQRIARIGNRNDKLRACDFSNLRIDIFGRDLKLRAFWQDIADFAEIGFVGRHVGRRAVLAIPVVELCLERIALFKKGAVLRRKFRHDRGERLEEGVRIDPGSGDCLVHDKIVKLAVELQPVLVDHAHDNAPVRYNVCLYSAVSAKRHSRSMGQECQRFSPDWQ